MNQKDEKDLVEKKIRQMGNDLIQCFKEEIFLCEISRDLDRFDRLTHLFHAHLNYEFVKQVRDKGLDKEIRKLADKAGRITT